MALEPGIKELPEGLEGGQYFQASYNFYGVRVCIRSDSEGPVSSLDSLYSFFREPGIDRPHLDMTILVNGRGASMGTGECAFARVPGAFDGWRTAMFNRGLSLMGSVSGEQQRVYDSFLSHIREITDPQVEEEGSRLYHISVWYPNLTLMATVESLVFLFVMYHWPHLYTVHAGSVSKGDRGVLLCGCANSGKTTLSYALARKGFNYLSDEYGLFAPETLEVYPFPRGISFKPEVVSLLPELGPVLEGKDVVWRQDKRHLVTLENLGFRVSKKPAKASYFFFVSHEANAVPSLKRMAPADAADRLLKTHNLWLAAPRESRSFSREEAAVRLCENAVCGELLSGDLDKTVALVNSVVDSGA